jgi:hypothetical protein
MQYFMGTHRLSFSEEVLRKIEQLRSMDAALKLFGAGTHRYRFNPPLEPEAVAAFEASQALRLPEDYREFILNVGNGGAGPCYGIYPLLPEGSIHHGWSNKDHARIDLSVPFPHAGDWDAAWLDEIDWDAGERPDDSLMEEYLDTRHMAGSLCLCHRGCGDFWLLVVKGDERGNIWMDGRGNLSGIFPESGAHGERLSFSQWYLNWLDECLKEAGADGSTA